MEKDVDRRAEAIGFYIDQEAQESQVKHRYDHTS